MKFSLQSAPKYIGSVLALLLLAAAPLAHAEGPKDEKDTPLEESMKVIGRSFKTLKTGMEAPDAAKKDDYLKAAAALKEEATKAKEFVPKKVEEMPEADKAAAVEAYKKQMDALIATADKLEPLLKDEKWTDASAVVQELRTEEGKGHKEFRKKD